MATVIASIFTGRAVQKDIAMTGEVTLQGRVLPVGGLKEKLLAANRAGMKEVILPKENERWLDKIPEEVKKKTKFTLVKHVSEVLDKVLEKNGFVSLAMKSKTSSEGSKKPATIFHGKKGDEFGKSQTQA